MTTTDTATTTVIPRLEGESNRAYEMRVRYVTMGPGRSIDKVGQQSSDKRAAGHIQRWASQFDWAATARAWDDQRAAEVSAAAADSYRRELEDHRERYGKAGKALHNLAAAYLNKLAQRIKDLDSSEIKAGRLALDVRTAAAALQIAGDLEAHALRVADLLPKLDSGDDRGE
jgi:hypothetical protein